VSAIFETLSRLDQVVGKLEQAAAEQEKKAAKQNGNQQDLFNMPQRLAGTGAGPVANPTVVPFDAALFTRKLDMTIRNVENLLKEG
jgi:hypothetical protein